MIYTESHTIKIYHVEVFYDVNFNMSIYSAMESKIKPVKLENDDIDQQALADYDTAEDAICEELEDYSRKMFRKGN